MKTEVIAEIGENHLGDVKIALDLITSAAKAGAHTVKFQSYNMDCIRENDPERDWFEKVMLGDNDHKVLQRACEDARVKFLSSPFSKERVDFLVDELGCTELKIASAMFYDKTFVDYVSSKKGVKKVYLSTGMATYREVYDTVDKLCEDIRNNIDVVLMHCVSLYPCPAELANLGRIGNFRIKYRYMMDCGYSDHVEGIAAAVAAVVLRAKVIEKHFTFDTHFPVGTDHKLSVDECQMKEMIEKIREVENFLYEYNWSSEMDKARRAIIGRFIS